MRDIFDFDDGDFAFPLSDDYALDSDGDLMFRMDDNMAMEWIAVISTSSRIGHVMTTDVARTTV